MKYKTLVWWRRDRACPPVPPLSFTIITYYLFGVYRIRGEPQQRGWTPRERLACNWAFPMKIVLFRYETGMVTTLSLRYDDCRRLRRDAPAADRWAKFKTTPCPAVPRRGPKAGVHCILAIFVITVWTLQIYVRFYRSWKFSYKNLRMYNKKRLRGCYICVIWNRDANRVLLKSLNNSIPDPVGNLFFCTL